MVMCAEGMVQHTWKNDCADLLSTPPSEICARLYFILAALF